MEEINKEIKYFLRYAGKKSYEQALRKNLLLIVLAILAFFFVFLLLK
jgi:hypothetical protein